MHIPSRARPLESRYPARCATWNRTLEILNTARNGIAHDDRSKLAKARASGWPMTLHSVSRWRSALSELAQGMDETVKEHLERMVGTSPW
jgi:hypothetical protein